jgi:DNA-binding CsgD family transcriptional regulator
MDQLEEPRLQLVIGLVFLLVVVGGITDLYLDAPDRLLSVHVVLEATLVVVSLGLGLYLLRGWHRATRSLRVTRRELEARSEDRDRWRSRAEKMLRGLGREMDRQFDAWELTPSEKEVALLLVKGHPHKRIATLTDRSVRTVRQHATAVYAKAGLSGRHELAAFFLEELMLPRDASEPPSAEGANG